MGRVFFCLLASSPFSLPFATPAPNQVPNQFDRAVKLDGASDVIPRRNGVRIGVSKDSALERNDHDVALLDFAQTVEGKFA